MYLLFTYDYSQDSVILLSNGCRLILIPCNEGFYLEQSFLLGVEKVNELNWPYTIVNTITTDNPVE